MLSLNRYFFILLISLFSFPIVSWGHSTDYKKINDPIGKFGGVLNLAIPGSGPKTFNLWASTDKTSSDLASLMFSSLFEDDPDTAEVKPHLAKSYEIKDGGKKIIVKLRNNITWSDGKPITADDVVFTWNEIIFNGYEGGGFQSLCLIDGKYPEVKKINDSTVEFKTHVVFAPFLRQIGYPIAPKHVFAPIIKNSKNKDEAKKRFLQFWGVDTKPENFITSGPFKLKRYIQGERIEFEKNLNYFVVNSENKKLPYLDKIIYTLVQDPSLEIFKFLANELDVISVNGEEVLLLKKLQEKKKTFQLVNLGASGGTEFLLFNLGIKGLKHKWFNNLYFRQAVSRAIDREGIVDNVLAGIGKPLFTPEPLSSVFLNKSLEKGYPQDLNLSKELLKKGGFKWSNKGDLLDNENNKIEFNLFTNAENPSRQSIGVIIQDDLSKLGIKVNFKPIDFNTLILKTDTHEWDSIILGLTGSLIEPNGGANVWKINGRLHLFDMSKHKPRDWEIEIDNAFNEGTRFIEFEKRKKIYDKFQEIVYRELPFIYLTSPLRISAYQNTLKNVRPTIYGGILYNLESIYK